MRYLRPVTSRLRKEFRKKSNPTSGKRRLVCYASHRRVMTRHAFSSSPKPPHKESVEVLRSLRWTLFFCAVRFSAAAADPTGPRGCLRRKKTARGANTCELLPRKRRRRFGWRPGRRWSRLLRAGRRGGRQVDGVRSRRLHHHGMMQAQRDAATTLPAGVTPE
jgi:hypothetical protein